MTRAALVLAMIAASTSARAQAGPHPPLPAGPPPPPPPPMATEDEVRQLREVVEALRAEMAERQALVDQANQAAERAAQVAKDADDRAKALADALARERAERMGAAAERPGAVLSAGPVKLSLGLFVQIDTVLHQQSSSDELDPSTRAPLNRDRIVLRRGRLRLDADAGVLGARLELDANTVNGSQVRVIGAELDARIPWRAPDRPRIEAVAGLFRIPFGLETRQPYQERLFLEEGNAVRALFPGDYDLGLGARVSWRWLRFAAAWMNGDPSGEKAFPSVDPNGAKDISGRVALVVGRAASPPGQVDTAARGVGVEVGASALAGSGFHSGQGPSKDVLIWRDDNEDGIVQITELQVLPGQAATASADFDRFAIGGDLRVIGALGRYGEVVGYGELIHAQDMDRAQFVADPTSIGRHLRENGVMLGLTWDAPFGAQAGVRYDRYDPDADAFEQQAGTVVPRDPVLATTALAIGWRLRGSGRVLLEYDRQRNPFGRDAAADPTTRADDGVTLRLEGAF